MVFLHNLPSCLTPLRSAGVCFDPAVVPASGIAAPVGWSCLSVFEKAGKFVATGHYQLPLFQGVPSSTILQEMASKGNVDEVMANNLKVCG